MHIIFLYFKIFTEKEDGVPGNTDKNGGGKYSFIILLLYM